ncbi:MAG TPA: response regulator transcription factor [Chitinophagaceae bacterium]|nr:response regulator transcription factor [Chitinophagaceae bacterium]
MPPITIAIVEDLDEVRDGLVYFINLDPELDVIEAFGTAEEAIASIPVNPPDIVIMDINLPGMSGINCILEIKDSCPGTQFMMFTVYENDDKVFEALKAGASSYLLKKTPPASIVESLKDLYRGGSPMSSNIARKLVSSYHTKETTARSLLLSPRENEILELLAKGLLYKEIADKLTIATGTVRQHIHKIYEKLHVQNRTEAINKVRNPPRL